MEEAEEEGKDRIRKRREKNQVVIFCTAAPPKLQKGKVTETLPVRTGAA